MIKKLLFPLGKNMKNGQANTQIVASKQAKFKRKILITIFYYKSLIVFWKH